MSMTELENFYESLEEPNKGCFLFLRKHFLELGSEYTEHWKWKLPFFYYKKKPFCYIWFDKKTNFPYVCFTRSLHINRPEMQLGERKKMKAFTINPNSDIDIKTLNEIIKESLTKFD